MRAKMDKENRCAKHEERSVRITRARARALGSIGGIPPSSRPSFKPEQKRVIRANYRKGASDENKTSVAAPAGLNHKRKTVLTDITNVNETSYNNIVNASKFQARDDHTRKNMKLAADISREVPPIQEDVKTKLVEELSKIRMVESHDTIVAVRLADKDPLQNSTSSRMIECDLADPMLSVQDSTKPDELLCLPYKDIDMIHSKLRASDDLGIVDIDSEIKDHQVWTSYAADIYNNIRVTELERRSSADYMDKLQQDITPDMRAILVDWLVEVSDEYKLVPDTLYLTVNLIDRFLSKTLIQKQRLQLLGVTCMLIASKYEEMCAPRVEEFCFITDSTYTRGEVLKMESEVLNVLHFQLSVPTTKTFLRRFILAAQSSSKVRCVELEYLANYLAELTLVECSFLKFIPSLIAASAVFLARWTLNPSDHPWNPTLRHYTNYEVSELKTAVLALQDLQLNTKGCSLNAIREKYTQQKFKCVAALSPKSVASFF